MFCELNISEIHYKIMVIHERKSLAMNTKMEINENYRTEEDSIGTKAVPEGVYYGVQSLRAAENFQIGRAHV